MATKRKNGDANSGYVKWPTHLKNTNEGGMFVVAVFENIEFNDFINCCGVECANIRRTESQLNLHKEIFPNYYETNLGDENPYRHFSIPMLGAIVLGSSSGSWYNESTEKYFVCTRNDLTEEGLNLIDLLEKLYGFPAKFITFLDT